MKGLKAGTLALGAVLGLWAGGAVAQTTDTDTTTTTTTSSTDTDVSYDSGPDQSGVYLLFGGGIQGYTGDQGDLIKLGPAAGIHLGLQPFPIIGFELGYTGGLHNFELDLRDGSDFIRHGAHAVAESSPR